MLNGPRVRNVPLLACIVPWLLNVPLMLSIEIVPPATSAMIVPWLMIVPPAKSLANPPELPTIVMFGPMVRVPLEPVRSESLSIVSPPCVSAKTIVPFPVRLPDARFCSPKYKVAELLPAPMVIVPLRTSPPVIVA